ncbi:HNH endonuclease [Methylobacterium oxalidis]|uniref:HNH endonuclease n=1 Tax=Methylobacterium oxalidis TaxID=944322 RepID=UPI0033148F23
MPDRVEPPIGRYVKSHIGNIISYCEINPDEIGRLLDKDFTKKTFRLPYAFFCSIEDAAGVTQRYWRDQYNIGGRRLRVCSQWLDKHWKTFNDYLASIGVQVEEPGSANQTPLGRFRANQRPNNRRFGSVAIGDAQNVFIRFILSNLGEESFAGRDWELAKDFFTGRCAYCGEEPVSHMDHGFPINKTSLGEHRLGNLIPSCAACNSRKHDSNVSDLTWLSQERRSKIETYMESRGYVPLEGNQIVQALLDQAHKDVAALAERYVAILNTVLDAVQAKHNDHSSADPTTLCGPFAGSQNASAP